MCYCTNPDKRFLAIQSHPNPIVPVPSGHQGTAALPRQGATAAGPFLLQVLEMFAPKRTLRRINQKAHKSCRRVLNHSSCRNGGHGGNLRPSKAQEKPEQAMNGNSRLAIARCSRPGTRNRCRLPVAGLPPNHHHERNGMERNNDPRHLNEIIKPPRSSCPGPVKGRHRHRVRALLKAESAPAPYCFPDPAKGP